MVGGLMLARYDAHSSLLCVPACSVLGSQGKRVHVERIHSLFGHDAFLKEVATFNPRFAEFINTDSENGVDRVRQYVNSLFDI